MLDTEDKFSQVLDREGGKDDEGERWWEGEGKGEQRERERQFYRHYQNQSQSISLITIIISLNTQIGQLQSSQVFVISPSLNKATH